MLTAADNVSDFRGTIAAEAVFTRCARKLLAQAPRLADPEIDIVRCAHFHRHQAHYRNATFTECENSCIIYLFTYLLILGKTRSVMYKLNKLWKNKRISIETKKRLMSTLVWPVATYGCESWTTKKEVLKKIQSFEMAGYRKILRVSWVQKRTNDSVLAEIGNDLELVRSTQCQG